MSFIDIHCHPSMMMYLADGNIANGEIPCIPGNGAIAGFSKMKTSLPRLVEGKVNAAVSVYYLPERQLLLEANQNIGYVLLQSLLYAVPTGMTVDLVRIKSKFDVENSNERFERLQFIIQQFESQIAKNKVFTYKDGTKYSVTIAKNYADFIKQTSLPNNIVFLHSVEGANGLGNKLDQSISSKIVNDRINILIDKGMCQFTIGHFFENILVSSSGGIDPKTAKITNYALRPPTTNIDPRLKNTYPNGYNEFDGIFVNAINLLLDRGVIVDLVHSDKRARKKIFDLNDLRGTKKRPIVFSHTGVKFIADQRNKPGWLNDKNSREALPDDDEIRRVKDSNGVIGIIFMNYWLCGEEENTNGFVNILLTIRHIRELCSGSIDHIAFGTDMDGLTSVPPDLNGSDKIPTILLDQLRNEKYSDGTPITESDIQKMSFDNYNRVLKLGWGTQESNSIA